MHIFWLKDTLNYKLQMAQIALSEHFYLHTKGTYIHYSITNISILSSGKADVGNPFTTTIFTLPNSRVFGCTKTSLVRPEVRPVTEHNEVFLESQQHQSLTMSSEHWNFIPQWCGYSPEKASLRLCWENSEKKNFQSFSKSGTFKMHIIW